MATIKEKRNQLSKSYSDYIREYNQTVYMPALKQIETECEAAGHVNLNTLTQNDGPNYFLCDNCGKKVHL